MNSNPKLIHTLLQTIAPAHTRRKRARNNQMSTEAAVFFDSALFQTPRIAPQSTTQLQAAHNARCADEVRSSLC